MTVAIQSCKAPQASLAVIVPAYGLADQISYVRV